MRRRAKAALGRMGLDIAPETRGRRAFARRAADWSRSPRRCRTTRRVLVLDEPTAALGAARGRAPLRGPSGASAAQGIAILYVSHRFAEVLDLCDRATVLRNGRVGDDDRASRAGPRRDLTEAMVGGAGRALSSGRRRGERRRARSSSARASAGATRVRDVALRGPCAARSWR